jgi:murein DD-endopeptidase MepM/ murein hydrolase activator NlpD
MRPRALKGRVVLAVAGATLLLAPSAPATAGGTPAPPRGGGTAYGAPLPKPDRRPVATRLQLAPARVVAGGKLPRISFRVRQRGMTRVKVRIAVLRLPAQKTVVGIAVGWVKTGRIVRVRLPAGTALRKGRYLVRLHATDRRGRTLRRTAKRPGRARIVVTGVPQPTTASPGGRGVFPVAGPFDFGGADARFGAGREGHIHQGQDIMAAKGLPVVAPYAGTVTSTSYQASAAGEYVVLDAVDGRDYFFAHCVRHSTVVVEGSIVEAGGQLCSVGATGSATGPHLHFEIWRVGWRVRGGYPIDPLPELRTWAGR